MKRRFGIIVFCLLLAAGMGILEQTQAMPVTEQEMTDLSLQVALPDGEVNSPDGRYTVRTEGSTDQRVSGCYIPEFLQIVDTDLGMGVWQDTGWLRQSVSWSPDGEYLALAYGGRTWNAVRVLRAGDWLEWKFTLPDGSAIPEYTFLPETDWSSWQDNSKLLLTVGRGGDAGEQTSYLCTLRVEPDQENAIERLTGVVCNRTELSGT